MDQSERFEHYVRSGAKRLRLGYTTGTCAALAAAGAACGLLTGQIPETLRLVTPKGLEVCVRPETAQVCREETADPENAQDSSRAGTAPEKTRKAPEEAVHRECQRKKSLPVRAVCGVRKDAGDDIDATDGLLILADAVRHEREAGKAQVRIAGGRGIGRVTKPGLDQKVGEAAINTVPRQMIRREVQRICRECGYEGGITITISAPDGEKAADRTFNEQLGIVGGISIIGTSGIVEPMSMTAYADAVRLEIRQAAAISGREKGLLQDIQKNPKVSEKLESSENPEFPEKERIKNKEAPKSGENRERHSFLILTPGNYGLTFIKEHGYHPTGVPVVVCSNFIGDALDEAAADGFDRILLIGHIGKLVKLAAGIMNTHSLVADGRCEIFTAHAAMAGAREETCRRLMEAATTDACIAILREKGLADKVLASIMEKAQKNLDRRCPDAECGMIAFSMEYGELGRTEKAQKIFMEAETETLPYGGACRE